MSLQASLPPFDLSRFGRWPFIAACLCLVCSLAGCAPEAAIGQYKVPHEATASAFDFTRPDGWLNGMPGPMQMTVFIVRDGESRAEITVSALEAGGSALLPNVNRWRGQMGVAPLEDEAKLQPLLKTVPVAGLQGYNVQIAGEGEKQGQAIDGVILIEGGLGWFFKLSGDAKLVERERERFLQFVASIKFRPLEGDAHGHR